MLQGYVGVFLDIRVVNAAQMLLVKGKLGAFGTTG